MQIYYVQADGVLLEPPFSPGDATLFPLSQCLVPRSTFIYRLENR